MPPFNTALHKNMMFQFLTALYSDSECGPFLGFKGGTAAMIFYGLDRFSVDLDFDLLDKGKEQMVFDKIQKIGEKFGKIREAKIKRFNLLVILSYEENGRNLKVEVNRRAFGSHFKPVEYFGTPLSLMEKEDMFAHKMMAMVERIGKTSRDIYDVHFFLKNRWPIREEAIKNRMNLSLSDLVIKAIAQLENMPNKNILDGLGELLTESHKMWAREKLRIDTIQLLQLFRESQK